MRSYRNNRTVVIHFDGVIHSYSSGWQGEDVANDPIVPGVDEELKRLHEDGYRVIVVSTRCKTKKGMKCVKDYLWRNNLLRYVDSISDIKPNAIFYIDNKAVCFGGQLESSQEKIQYFKPENK